MTASLHTLREAAGEPGATGRHRFAVAAIVVLAVALRLAAAAKFGGVDRGVYPDAGDYHDLAAAIVSGGEYRTAGGIATRMPGYPLLVAGIYGVFGVKESAVLALQAAMGGATCLLIWTMLRRRWPTGALAAALLFAVDPVSIGMSALLLSETPFTLTLLGLLAIALRLWRTPGDLRMWAALGVVGGAAIYLRAAALYLPAVLAAAILARHASWRTAAGVTVAVAIILAALLPWKVFLGRHDATRELAGLTSLEGISLYEAVYDEATGGPRQGDILLAEPASISSMTEARRDAHYAALARAEMRSHPGRVLGLAPVKLGRTLFPGLNAGALRRPGLELVLWTFYFPLLCLAGVGLCCRPLGMSRRVVLGAAVGYVLLLHTVFIGSVRYRVPLHPVICMLAVVGAAALMDKRQRPVMRDV